MPPVNGGDIYLSPMNMVDASKPQQFPAGKTEPTKAQIDEIGRILS